MRAWQSALCTRLADAFCAIEARISLDGSGDRLQIYRGLESRVVQLHIPGVFFLPWPPRLSFAHTLQSFGGADISIPFDAAANGIESEG